MTGMKVQVYKKILWKLKDMTKEKFEDYKVAERLDSLSTRIAIGDNITEWYLDFCPGGHNEEAKDSIGLFLMLKGADSRSFKTKFTLGIVGKNGNKEFGSERPGESFKIGFGTDELLKRADFVNPDQGYLVDGKATIYCKLTITAEKAPESNKKDSLNQNQLNKFKRMMDDEHFADFEIETTEKNNEKKILKAHKCVLAFGSPYFYGMLTTAMKETEENVVKVPEDSAVMKEVLRFIYTGDEAENLNEIANELVFAAEKYQLDDLKQMCLVNIIESLSTENVLQALLAADSLTDSEKLKVTCIEMISCNFESLSSSDQWEKLPRKLFLEIMQEMNNESRDTIYV